MIDFVNDQFVPVWINVRTTAVPDFPFIGDVLLNAKLDEGHFVKDVFSQGFFVRSVIVTPDGKTLLNRETSTTFMGGMAHLATEGTFSYAAVDPGDYLSMLKHSLDRFRGN